MYHLTLDLMDRTCEWSCTFTREPVCLKVFWCLNKNFMLKDQRGEGRERDENSLQMRHESRLNCLYLKMSK